MNGDQPDGPMCPPKDFSLHDNASEIAELLADPPLSLAELFEDPEVRSRSAFLSVTPRINRDGAIEVTRREKWSMAR
jgi:hypothetical protein